MANSTQHIHQLRIRRSVFRIRYARLQWMATRFSSCDAGMICAILNEYPGHYTGFDNFVISNNTLDGGALFVSDGCSVTNCAFSTNTVESGELFKDSFGSGWSNFTVDGTVIEGNGWSTASVSGDVAIWTNTTRPVAAPYGEVNNWNFYSGNSGTISFASDLLVLNSNPAGSEPFTVAIDPTTLGDYPVGFTVTLKPWTNTNWYIKADPTWNTFSADIPVGANGVTIEVNSDGLFAIAEARRVRS